MTILITVLLTAIIVFYFIRKRLNPSALQEPANKRPAQDKPIHPKQNDKLVHVIGINYSDLKKVLEGFCNMYNKESYQGLPRVFKISDREFVITFPYDISFEIYCYFINYLVYPLELKWSAVIRAWTTTKAGDNWLSESQDKKVMLFVSPGDTEYDNVHLITKNNNVYKIGFASKREKQLPEGSTILYNPPAAAILAFSNKEFEDFG